MPEPSPSFRKNAPDLGDQEIIAGGTSLEPAHRNPGRINPADSEITPSAEILSSKRPFGEVKTSWQSATMFRNAEFQTGRSSGLTLASNRFR